MGTFLGGVVEHNCDPAPVKLRQEGPDLKVSLKSCLKKLNRNVIDIVSLSICYLFSYMHIKQLHH
jgi:hypothetical protein